MFYSVMKDTPVGPLVVAGDQCGLRYVAFDSAGSPKSGRSAVQGGIPGPHWELSDRDLKDPLSQLKAYFSGRLKRFDLNLAPAGTEFQRRVWTALCDVPYGETATYGEIAQAIGQPAASRAVGMANGRNPLAIVIPCHRIIGTSGKLVGYGGGLDRKTTLLRLECVAC